MTTGSGDDFVVVDTASTVRGMIDGGGGNNDRLLVLAENAADGNAVLAAERAGTRRVDFGDRVLQWIDFEQVRVGFVRVRPKTCPARVSEADFRDREFNALPNQFGLPVDSNDLRKRLLDARRILRKQQGSRPEAPKIGPKGMFEDDFESGSLQKWPKETPEQPPG